MRKQPKCDACLHAGRDTESKYRCPACDVASCSVPCVKQHKERYGCEGKRDRAAHVRKAEYTPSHFQSDVELLQDARRITQSAQRKRHDAPGAGMPPAPQSNPNNRNIGKGGHGGGGQGGQHDRRRQGALRREAALRGTRLHFVAPGLQRSVRNGTAVRRVGDDGARALFWSVEVWFGGRVSRARSVGEGCVVGDVVAAARGALRRTGGGGGGDGGGGGAGGGDGMRRGGDVWDAGEARPFARDACDEGLRTADAADLVVFLRNEAGTVAAVERSEAVRLGPNGSKRRRVDANGGGGNCDGTADMEGEGATGVSAADALKRYVEVDAKQTLREALQGRTVVEYPVLHVAVRGSERATELGGAVGHLFERPESEAHGAEGAGADDETDDESGEEGEIDDGKVIGVDDKRDSGAACT